MTLNIQQVVKALSEICCGSKKNQDLARYLLPAYFKIHLMHMKHLLLLLCLVIPLLPQMVQFGSGVGSCISDT